jgi:hypothetical protein
MRRGSSGQPELAQDCVKAEAAATERWPDRPRLELAARLSTDSVQGLRDEQAAERLPRTDRTNCARARRTQTGYFRRSVQKPRPY